MKSKLHFLPLLSLSVVTNERESTGKPSSCVFIPTPCATQNVKIILRVTQHNFVFQIPGNLSLPGGFRLGNYSNQMCDVKTATGGHNNIILKERWQYVCFKVKKYFFFYLWSICCENRILLNKIFILHLLFAPCTHMINLRRIKKWTGGVAWFSIFSLNFLFVFLL